MFFHDDDIFIVLNISGDSWDQTLATVHCLKYVWYDVSGDFFHHNESFIIFYISGDSCDRTQDLSYTRLVR
jgi:hypothetical protein